MFKNNLVFCACGEKRTVKSQRLKHCYKCPKCGYVIHDGYDIIGHSASGCNVKLSEMIVLR